MLIDKYNKKILELEATKKELEKLTNDFKNSTAKLTLLESKLEKEINSLSRKILKNKNSIDYSEELFFKDLKSITSDNRIEISIQINSDIIDSLDNSIFEDLDLKYPIQIVMSNFDYLTNIYFDNDVLKHDLFLNFFRKNFVCDQDNIDYILCSEKNIIETINKLQIDLRQCEFDLDHALLSGLNDIIKIKKEIDKTVSKLSLEFL